MNKILDPRRLVFFIGAEQMLMPAEGQWDDEWMAAHPFVLSPLTIARQRQGSLGDPEASQCAFTIVVPVDARSSQDPDVGPFADFGGAPSFNADVTILVQDPDDEDSYRYLFFGTIESMVMTDHDPVRLLGGTQVDARTVEVTAAGLLQTLQTAKIGITPPTGETSETNTVMVRVNQLTAATEQTTGRRVVWDEQAPPLPTSWLADRDIDSYSATDIFRETVGLADHVTVERFDGYSLVHRNAITEVPYDWYITAPYRRDTGDVIHVPASAVPYPAWVLDRDGVVTRFAATFVDETALPGVAPPFNQNDWLNNNGEEWLETHERTEATHFAGATVSHSVSSWQVTGDGLRTIRPFGQATPPGGPGNAAMRGSLIRYYADPQWRPDSAVPLILDQVTPGILDPLLYAHEPPYGYPLVVVDGAPAGRDQWRVVGSTLAIGHPDDEAVTLSLEHPRLGLPTGVRIMDVDPMVTVADMAPTAMTYFDATQAAHIESGRPLVPPGTPTNLKAARVSDALTDLTWTTSGGPATATHVEEQINAGPWTTAAVVSAGQGQATVTTARDRSTYYRVRSSNPAGTSGVSGLSNYVHTTPDLSPRPTWRWSGNDIVGTWPVATAIPASGYRTFIFRGIFQYPSDESPAGYTVWDGNGPSDLDHPWQSLAGGVYTFTWTNPGNPPGYTDTNPRYWAFAVRTAVLSYPGGPWLASGYYTSVVHR